MSPSEGLREAVSSGDRRRALTALRDRLAGECEIAEGRDLAPLSKQLADVIRELDGLPVAKEESRLDELRRRREARGPTASSQ